MLQCGSKKIFKPHRKIESCGKLKRAIRAFVAKYQSFMIAENLRFSCALKQDFI